MGPKLQRYADNTPLAKRLFLVPPEPVHQPDRAKVSRLIVIGCIVAGAVLGILSWAWRLK